MKLTVEQVRRIIAEEMDRGVRGVTQDMKNVGHPHKKTVAGSRVVRMMHDAPGVLPSLADVSTPQELAHIIEAIIDSVPVVRRADVMAALNAVTRHEKATHRR